MLHYLIPVATAAYAVFEFFFPATRSQTRSRPVSAVPNAPPHEQQTEPDPLEEYASLRAKAKQEGDLMSKCRQQSKEAYERRDHALAKTLSNQAKLHANKLEKLNARASSIIYRENNKDKPACEVDLHGLFVKEAIDYSEKALKIARQRGDPEIRLIVGQGNHSDGGISRLKPAIQDAMTKIRWVNHVQVDPKNPGVLLVSLDT